MHSVKKKKRLDVILTEKGLAPTRSKARSLIMAGMVIVNDKILDKPGSLVHQDATISLKERPCPYVSRGGMKLERALDHFAIDVRDKLCLDIGASTGGFTHCLLSRGARLVVAIDVGYGQLDWSLRTDPRVVVMERTNFRLVDPKKFPYKETDLIAIDVSFISLKLILPIAKNVLSKKGVIVALLKPQFEVGKNRVGKGGIVKDPSLHKEIKMELSRFSSEVLGMKVIGIIDSPIKGAKGNREFLMALKNPQPEA